MIFKTIVLTTCIIGSVHMQSTPIQTTFNAKIQNLLSPAKSISIVNGPLIVVGLGPLPQIIAGIQDIVNTLSISIAADDQNALDTPKLDDPYQVCILMDELTGKAGLLNTVPLIGAPVAASLRQLEGVIDTKVFQGIDKLDRAGKTTESTKLKAELERAVACIDVAIKSYEGLAGNVV